MMPLINHITPRSETKRCTRLQDRASEILHKRLLEHGAVDVEQTHTDYALLMNLETVFGALQFTIFKRLGWESNTFALFGRFLTDDTELIHKASRVIIGMNPYSGKWNHYAELNYNGMENLLGSLARYIPQIILDKKAKALSEPNY